MIETLCGCIKKSEVNMAMNWERVKGVLESSDKVKEASKVGE